MTAPLGWAVETVVLDLGLGQASFRVDDLEKFAATGEIPASMKRYQPVLTPLVRRSLQDHLNVEPAIRDRFIQDLIDAKNGRPVITVLSEVAPGVEPEAIQAAIQTAEESAAGVTAITLLQALPDETLTLNGLALLKLASQLGLTHLEQSALGKVLNHELGSRAAGSLTTHLEPSKSGNREYEHWSVSFRDRDRDRVIPIDLYWSEHRPGPTVVLSHGFGADRHFLDYMAQHLASHGMTVVALEHPGSNVEALFRQEGDLLPASEFLDRPRDVSFILDRLTDLNRHSFFLRGRLNLEQITLVGHSLGGYTGLVLAGGKVNPVTLAEYCSGVAVGASSPADWFQCAATDAELPKESLADARISRLVLMNPLAGHIFGDDGLRQVKVPTLFVTSTRDGIASVSDQQLRPFNQLAGPRSLVAVIGGTHLSVGDPKNINPALTRVPFMPEPPEHETVRLRQYLNGTVLSFVMQQTYQAHKYQPFLSAEYAQLFSTTGLPIRYSDRLPESVNRWLTNRDRFTGHLTPTLKSIASLLHLEVIDVQNRLAALRRDTIAQAPLQPMDLAARLAPRSATPYQTADIQAIHESSRPAE